MFYNSFAGKSYSELLYARDILLCFPPQFVADSQANIPNVPLVANVPLTCSKFSNIQMLHL